MQAEEKLYGNLSPNPPPQCSPSPKYCKAHGGASKIALFPGGLFSSMYELELGPLIFRVKDPEYQIESSIIGEYHFKMFCKFRLYFGSANM